MNNYRKTEKLIREGYLGTQDKLTDIMMEIKRSNPDLTHPEIMDLFQKEVDKFIGFHKKDRMDLPIGNHNKVLSDRIPMMKIPYGKKNKGGF